MERQRREEELKTRTTKKGQDAEQAMLNRVGDLFLQCKVDEFGRTSALLDFVAPVPWGTNMYNLLF